MKTLFQHKKSIVRGDFLFGAPLEQFLFVTHKSRIYLRLERHTPKKEPEPLLNQPSREIILQRCFSCHAKTQ